MIDNEILRGLVDYNRYKYFCFDNLIPIESNLFYDRLLKARYNKVSRIKKRFLYLLTKFRYIYFVTFTFDNKYITYNEQVKRRIIKKSLSSFSSDIHYILNVDYGSQTERQHYHGIIATNNSSSLKKYLQESYNSFTWVERIRTDKKSISKLSKYINKLSNHATKSTTKNSRVIYNFKGFDIWGAREESLLYTFYSDLIGIE